MWYASSYIWIMNNFPTCEKKTGGSRNVVLQKHTENPMDVANKQWRNLKRKMSIKGTLVLRIRKRDDISCTQDEDGGLGKLNPHTAYWRQ